MNNHIVITGSLHSGKTTVIDLLRQRGFVVFQESARLLIESRLSEGLSIKEIRNDEGIFSKSIFELQSKQELRAPKDKRLVFFDRALPDTLAYMLVYGSFVKEGWMKKICSCDYRKVFLLDYFPFPKTDGIRTEDERTQSLIHCALRITYCRLGFSPIAVPKELTPNQRIAMILSHLQRAR